MKTKSTEMEDNAKYYAIKSEVHDLNMKILDSNHKTYREISERLNGMESSHFNNLMYFFFIMLIFVYALIFYVDDSITKHMREHHRESAAGTSRTINAPNPVSPYSQ